MKKSVIAALTVIMIMLAAGNVFAEEYKDTLVGDIKLDGSLTIQYRNDSFKNPDAPVRNGFKTTLIINAEKDLVKNLALYARFAYQYQEKDYFLDYANPDHQGGFIDAIGLKYNNAGVNYVVGSQALTLGATGIAYDNGYVGRNALPYAAVVDGKAGAVNLRTFYARTNYQPGYDNDKFYGVEASYAFNDKTTVGALLVRENMDSINEKATIYTLNATHKFSDKFDFTAEYLKSNLGSDNKGYAGVFSYQADAKNKFGLGIWRVEENSALYDANIGSMTTFWPNAKGYHISWSHQIGRDVTLNVSDYVFKKINNSGGMSGGIDNDRNSFRMGVTVNF